MLAIFSILSLITFIKFTLAVEEIYINNACNFSSQYKSFNHVFQYDFAINILHPFIHLGWCNTYPLRQVGSFLWGLDPVSSTNKSTATI